MVFGGLRSLPIPALATVANFTLNNNYRYMLTASFHLTSRATSVKLPRARLNVVPN